MQCQSPLYQCQKGIIPFRGTVDAELVISDINLKIKQASTDLGLIMDENLKWHNQKQPQRKSSCEILKGFQIIR